MAPPSSCCCATVQLLVIILQLLVHCSAEQDLSQCLSDVGPYNYNKGHVVYPCYNVDCSFRYAVGESDGDHVLGQRKMAVTIVGDILSKSSLLYVVHYAVRNASDAPLPGPLLLNVTNDDEHEDCANSTVPIATYVASRSAHHAALGPMTWDFLTLGAMDAAERTNVTTIILPAPPCPGSEETVYVKTLRQVLDWSGIDRDKVTSKPLSDRASLHVSQVNLFMATGLLSLFLTFIVFPLLSLLFYDTFRVKVSEHHLSVAHSSSLVTVALLSATFMTYFVLTLVIYYECYTADDLLFPNTFLSPMTQCLIFYVLSGLISFFGGALGKKFNGSKKRLNLLERMGTGLLFATTNAALFHFFFLLLAMLEDPLTIMSYLIVFATTTLLLFLAVYAMILQYKKTGFSGHFALVVIMQMIVSSMYVIAVHSFGGITCDEDTYVATKSYLCVVTVVSVICVSLSVSITIMVADCNKRNARMNRSAASRANDPENPITNDYTQSTTVSEVGTGGEKAPGDGEMEGRELQVVGGGGRVAELTALAQEMGFVVLLPNIVEAWQKRKKHDDVNAHLD